MFWMMLLIIGLLVYIACALTDLVKMLREMHSMASVTKVRVNVSDQEAGGLADALTKNRRTDHPPNSR